MLALSKADAKKFFNGLYKGRPAATSVDRGDFYEIATKLVARSKNQTNVGTTALQALMLNYLTQQQSGKLSSVDQVSIAHISRPGVGELLRSFPDVTLEKLIESARKSGYEVEVLGDPSGK